MSENTFVQKKVSCLVLVDNFRWNLYFYSVSWFSLFWADKTDSVNENGFFSLPDTNSVRQVLIKIHFFISPFLDDHLKKHYFLGFFFLFFFCLFLCLQHKKDKNKECNFIFENLIFDIQTILQNDYFGTMWHYLCFQTCPKNTLQMGKTVKTWTSFKLVAWTSFNL